MYTSMHVRVCTHVKAHTYTHIDTHTHVFVCVYASKMFATDLE